MKFIALLLTIILTTNALAVENNNLVPNLPEYIGSDGYIIMRKIVPTPPDNHPIETKRIEDLLNELKIIDNSGVALYESICPMPNLNGSEIEAGLIKFMLSSSLSSCGFSEAFGDIKGNLISGITIVNTTYTNVDEVQSDCNEMICRAKNAKLIIQRAEKVIDLSKNNKKQVPRNLSRELKKWKDFLSDPIESYSFEETEKYLSISMEKLIINQYKNLPNKAKHEYQEYFDKRLMELKAIWAEETRQRRIAEEKRKAAEELRIAEKRQAAEELRIAEEAAVAKKKLISMVCFFLLFLSITIRDQVRRRKFKILNDEMGKYIRKINPFEIFCINCHSKILSYLDNHIIEKTSTRYVRKDGTPALIATAQTRSSTAYTLDKIWWKCNSCSSEMITSYVAQLPRMNLDLDPILYKPKQIHVSNNSPIKFKVFKSKSDRDYYNYDSASGDVMERENKLGERGPFWYLFFLIFTGYTLVAFVPQLLL